MLQGSCLCGQCRFSVAGDISGPSVCHCTMCRKMSGHTWASAYAPEDRVTISGPVRWIEASPAARRGFCPDCGAFLFWKAHAEDTMSFALGCVDGESGLKLEKHIFTSTKGDYYEIGDGLPQKP